MGKAIAGGRSPSRIAALLGSVTVAAGLVAGCGSSSGEKINLYYYSEDNFDQVIANCNAAAGGKYEIVYNKLPRDADGQREQLVRRLAAGDTGVDIMGLDVTWVPEFAEAGWAEEWTGPNRDAATAGVLPGPKKTATWNDKIYAATRNTNVQLLWYDDRITPTPPKTWDEMMAEAQQLKAAGKPYQILFTGAQYEGLVVVYNTLTASAGGHILSEDGRSVVMDEGAVKALEVLKNLTTAGITNPSLTNQKEDDIRQTFQSGGAAFELNWPFVYASYAKDGDPEGLKHFKWTRYPAIDPRLPAQTTIGGFDMAVSSYSTKKEDAFQATLCMRNAENQKLSALTAGVPPSIESIYTDDTPLDPSKPASDDNKSMSVAYPMKNDILSALKDPAVRPLTPAYQNLSTVMSKVLSPPSEIDPQRTAQELRDRLNDALNSKGVIP